MKRHLKIAINVLASLLMMVTGTMQVAHADEVGLDFSVPQTDVTATSSPVASTHKAAPTAPSSAPTLNRQASQTTLSFAPSVVAGASLSAPSLIAMAQSADAIAQKRVEQASEDAAKDIAIDFSVPNADSATTTAGVPTQPEPSNPKPKPQPPKPSVSLPSTSTAKLSTGITRSKQVTALRRAIIGQESAGKFWIVNPDSGALGYGQLLKENVAPWTKAALGRALTAEEFLASPEFQIKTIDHKLDDYLQRALAYTGGSNEQVAIRRVAAAWYSGNPGLWNDTRPQYSNGQRYPSIESYTRSVWIRYLREIG